MGLLDGTTQRSYYTGTTFGNYQFVSLDHIISGFMISYVGENKLITKVNKADVQFHGMRAIQEFSYDIFRSIKSQEIEVPNTLKMILPQDYVNYCKITKVDSDGVERVLYPTGKTSNPLAINQATDGSYVFDHNNDEDFEDAGEDSLAYAADSDTWTKYKAGDTDSTTTEDYDREDHTVDTLGRRYGLDPQHAQANGTFYIDYNKGYIHFGSSLAGETIVLHYVSDGLGTDAEMVVHKFAEEAVYKWIAYGIISSRSNMPEYIVQRFKKERFAEARKAKIRLSNIKIEEFAQIIKGLGKPIK